MERRKEVVMLFIKKKVVVCGVLFLLGVLSAATAYAAEATKIKRSQVKFTTSGSLTQCSYPRSPAYNLGFTSGLSLMIAQVIVNIASGFPYCRKGLAPSTFSWIISLVCFTVSWFTFFIAYTLLMTGADLNDEHNEETMYVGKYFCYIVKPGVFKTGSVLSLVTVGLGIVHYLCMSSSSKQNMTATTIEANQGGGIEMGQPQIPDRVEDPVFVHDYTYIGRQFT